MTDKVKVELERPKEFPNFTFKVEIDYRYLASYLEWKKCKAKSLENENWYKEWEEIDKQIFSFKIEDECTKEAEKVFEDKPCFVEGELWNYDNGKFLNWLFDYLYDDIVNEYERQQREDD